MICTATSYGKIPTGWNTSIEVNGVKAVADDPDIAGIGVTIGFMLSAYVTLLLVIIHYLFNYQDTQNPIDRAWIRILTPKAWNSPQGRSSKKWTQALESAVLMYSDTQVLTGIAILLGAYSQLRRGISVYHWQVTVQLAWFSSMTHLTTLTSLRAYFRERPMMARWRVSFMGVTLLLLAIALVPTGYVNFSNSFENDVVVDTKLTPAVCLYLNRHLLGSFNMAPIALSLSILLTSYVTRVVKLFTPLSDRAHKRLRIKPGNIVKDCFDRTEIGRAESSGVVEKIAWISLQYFLMLSYVLFKAIYEIGESMLWEIIWLVTALVWGTLRLISLRLQADTDYNASGE
ncbi:hypothetical protein MMC22_009792, partial [Lobaria immixta]|nr:hypothetical protein [Lobaria immixta]